MYGDPVPGPCQSMPQPAGSVRPAWAVVVLTMYNGQRLRMLAPLGRMLAAQQIPVHYMSGVRWDDAKHGVHSTYIARTLAPPEILGTHMAHLRTWAWIARQTEYAHVLVLEDDVEFLGADQAALVPLVEQLIQTWPADADAIYMAHSVTGECNPPSAADQAQVPNATYWTDLMARTQWQLGLQAVLLNCTGAARILTRMLEASPVRYHVDLKLASLLAHGSVAAYATRHAWFREQASQQTTSAIQSGHARYVVHHPALQHYIGTPVLRVGSVRLYVPALLGVTLLLPSVLVAGLASTPLQRALGSVSAGMVGLSWLSLGPRTLGAVADVVVPVGLALVIALLVRNRRQRRPVMP